MTKFASDSRAFQRQCKRALSGITMQHALLPLDERIKFARQCVARDLRRARWDTRGMQNVQGFNRPPTLDRVANEAKWRDAVLREQEWLADQVAVEK